MKLSPQLVTKYQETFSMIKEHRQTVRRHREAYQIYIAIPSDQSGTPAHTTAYANMAELATQVAITMQNRKTAYESFMSILSLELFGPENN